MPIDPVMPPSLAAELQDIRNEISKLQRISQLPFSSTQGGALDLLDNDGLITRMSIGNVEFSAEVLNAAGQPGSTGDSVDVSGGYGVAQFDPHGAMILGQQDGHRGRIYPSQPVPFHSPDSVLLNTIDTDWTTCFEARVSHPVGEVLSVLLAVQVSAGSGGQGRVRLRAGDSTTTTELILNGTAGSSTTKFARWDWLHPGTVGIGDTRTGRQDELFLKVDGRLAAGAVNFFVFPPQLQEITSTWLQPDADVNGNARFV